MIHQQEEEIAIRKKEAGRFILATNLVDENRLNPEEIIQTYKNQQSCERGFRFLKDPLFFADSFFVENPERIETMLFLMSLCLLVYNLGQRELRNSLKRVKMGVKNQLGNTNSGKNDYGSGRIGEDEESGEKNGRGLPTRNH